MWCLALGGLLIVDWVLDNDIWFILNCGRYVTEHGIPYEEFASMHTGLHYVMEQWLTAVIFWKIYSVFGSNGLLTFVWIVGFIILFVYNRLCFLVSDKNQSLSFILTAIICIFVSMAYIVTRPQILSMMLILVEILILEKTFRDEHKWRLLILPLLSLVCINLHAALWPLMIIVMMPFLAEILLTKFKNLESKLNIRDILLVILGVFLAGFANPYGWEAMTFIFYSYDPSIHNNVTEVLPPSSAHFLGKIFFALSVWLIVIYSKKSIPIRYFLITFGFMLLAFMTTRGIFFFLMLSTFPIAYAYKDWKSTIVSGSSIFSKPNMLLPFVILGVAEIYKFTNDPNITLNYVPLPDKMFSILMLIFLICFIFGYKREGELFNSSLPVICIKPLAFFFAFQFILFTIWSHQEDTSKNEEPLKPAIDFILEQDRPENIVLFTGFNDGGYAGFRGLRYYIDARPEVFAKANNHIKDISKEYFDLRSGELSYKEFFSRYNFTHILVTDSTIILYLILEEDENYEKLFEYEYEQWGGKHKCRIFKPVER